MFVQSQMTYVSVAHRYWNSLWSPEENRKVYGAWGSIQGVGSNLKIILSVRAPGPLDFDFEPTIRSLKQAADHRCLFTDEPSFRSRPSTLENITVWLASQDLKIPLDSLVSIEVHESEKLKCCFQWGAADLTLTQKVGNLHVTVRGEVDVESGLLLPRESLPKIVAEIFPTFASPEVNPQAWLQRLAEALKSRLPMICSLVVDLGGQKSLRWTDDQRVLDR